VKPVLTPAEAAALDAATIASGVASETLIARAGAAVARSVLDVTGGAYGRRAVIVAGRGNNGGDGRIAGDHLARWGMRVSVHPVPGFDAANLARDLERADVVVDAIVGTGFRGVADGEMAAAIDAVNDAARPVVAVDIPSGVDGATGWVPGPAIWARLTVSFGAPKVGVLVLPGAELAGDVRVADIGFPDDLVPLTTGLTEPGDVDAVLQPRDVDTHKRASGVVLVVAGSRAMPGAARLVAGAAMRTGAGYVVVAAPAGALPAILQGAPEAVGVPLPETDGGTVAAGAAAAVLERAADAGAVAIGPGLTTHPETVEAVRRMVAGSRTPIVVDADALNAFAGDAAALGYRGSAAVLTPHLGELARLTDPGEDRLATARELAATTSAVALIKGTRSVVAEPGGSARINPTGTAALATAGTGDVLTGVIAATIARGATVYDAAWAGAYLHGLAGTMAAERRGDGVTAGDVLAALPDAIVRIRGTA
jgi:NAD(P)H-hydrate epimerase